MNWKDSINDFKDYLRIERGLSNNSVLSYENDLKKLSNFLNSKGEKIKRTAAAWYMMWSGLVQENEFPEYRVSNAKEIFKTNRSDGCGFEKGVYSSLPLSFIEDCPNTNANSQSPIISDDGIIPLDKEEIIKIFHNNCGESGGYSKLDINFIL